MAVVRAGMPSRAAAPTLTSPHPLGGFLPALYQEDMFAQSLTAAFDAVLAPIFSSLDNFEAYLDPGVAPEDFLDWLGGWVGLVVDETWPVDRRRAFISHAHELYRIRGTARGLAAHVAVFSGGQVDIQEPGATSWSATAGSPLPGSPGFDFVVRVTVDDPGAIDQGRLSALVGAAKPAHLTHRVEIVGKTPPAAAAPRPPRPRPAAPPASAATARESTAQPESPGEASESPAKPPDSPRPTPEPPPEGTA